MLDDIESGVWCSVCGDEVHERRALLGYDTCINHGAGRKTFTAVPVPKSNYVIATNPQQLLSPYSHKGFRP